MYQCLPITLSSSPVFLLAFLWQWPEGYSADRMRICSLTLDLWIFIQYWDLRIQESAVFWDCTKDSGLSQSLHPIQGLIFQAFGRKYSNAHWLSNWIACMLVRMGAEGCSSHAFRGHAYGWQAPSPHPKGRDWQQRRSPSNARQVLDSLVVGGAGKIRRKTYHNGKPFGSWTYFVFLKGHKIVLYSSTI